MQLASRDLLAHLVGALKPAERLVIDLLHLQQKSVAEVGLLTGWSQALVKVRAFRARQRLKAQLTRLGEKEGHV